MLETHPFGNFVPSNAVYLILGSFTAKPTDDSYDWFYATKRNQFWPILEKVYKLKLDSKESKQQLFTRLRIAIADIIYQCERKKGNSLDSNLTNIVYNHKGIEVILATNRIKKIFFSSRFVEKKFKNVFKEIIKSHPEIELITLPSP